MTGEWRELPLAECMAAIIDYRGKTPRKTTTGIPLVTAKIIKGGRIEQPGEFIDPTDYDEWMRRGMPVTGDIVLTTEAPLGEVAQLDGSKVALAQRVITLRGKEGFMDNTFLKFLMQSAYVQEQLKGRSTGTTVHGIRQSELRKVLLPVPPIQEQRAIAHVLGALDDKIELNRKMNLTLEAMARTIFKSWFVDFDPVRAKAEGRDPGLPPDLAALFPDSFEDSELGEIPKGWRVKTVADLAELNSWTLNKSDDLDRIEYVEISEVSKGDVGTIQIFQRGEEPSRARRRLRHGDTVLSTVRPDRGSYFLCLQPTENLVASTGFAVFTPTKTPWSLFHATLTQPELFEQLGHLADGGAYPAVRPEVIGLRQLPWPDKTAITDAFHGMCGPLYEKAEQNRRESRILAALRDTLLPKLLSGEIRVHEAN